MHECILMTGFLFGNSVFLVDKRSESEGAAPAYVEAYASGYAEPHARIRHVAGGRIQHSQGHPAESLTCNILVQETAQHSAYTVCNTRWLM